MATTVTLKPNAIDLSGSTSGTTTLQATAVAGTTTITLPAATDTLVGKATTDTLTNKTLTSPTITGGALNGTLGATTPSTVAATTLTASGTTTLSGNQIISVTDNSNAALRITQLGTGNALLVEDSTNPDSSPFVIDASGNVGIGTSSPGQLLTLNSALGSGFLSLTSSTTPTGDARLFGIGVGSVTDTLKARIQFQSSTTWTDGVSTPTYISFLTTASSSTTATERIRIDSSGNVGIGTSSPSTKLDTVGTYRLQLRTDDAVPEIRALTANGAAFKELGLNGLDLRFITSNTERMRIDSSGNVGIGTSSPTSALDVSGKITAVKGSSGGITIGDVSTNSNSVLRMQGTSAGKNWQIANNLNVAGLEFTPSTTNGGTTFTTPAVAIDSSGNLLVGTTSQIGSGKVNISFAGDSLNGLTLQTTYASLGSNYLSFYNSAGTNTGTINQNGTTTVAYSTSSDYRLKENIVPMTGALATVAQLKPVTYKWKSDGSDGQGFIAHELQAIVPDCVTGAKDAVDADGNPKYQGIDTSFLVATLTAALQETKALIDTQAETINALTARIVALETK